MAAQYPIANEEKYSHNGKPKNIPLNKISAIHNIEKRKLSQHVRSTKPIYKNTIFKEIATQSQDTTRKKKSINQTDTEFA